MCAANVTWNGISLHDVKEMDFTPTEKAKTTAGIFKVNQDDLATCVLPVPPLVAQIRIRDATERLAADGQLMADHGDTLQPACETLYQSVLKFAFAGALLMAVRPGNPGHPCRAATPSRARVW